MEKITIQNSRLGGFKGWEEIDRPDIIKVTAERTFKRNGDPKGYRYKAHLRDGTITVIRGNATRLYDNAYLYNSVVATGKTGLASVFSFGAKPAHHADKYLVTGFPVTLQAKPEPEASTSKNAAATTDNERFAQSVAWWFMSHREPFHYAYQNMTGLHVFRVETGPSNLKAAFAHARKIWAEQ